MSSKAPQMNSGERFPAIIPGTHQKVSYTGTAGVITNAVQGATSIIRVVCTTSAYVKLGTAPTATANDIFMPAGVPEYFGVPAGEGYKVSAIQVADAGTLHVTEGLGT